MPNYLTPERYRQMAFGLDVSAYEDVELRSTLTRASALVNTYCAVPMLPKPYDFRGGSIVGEQHPWHTGTVVIPPTRRIYVWHRPIKAVTEISIHVTSLMHINIGGTDIYINNSEGYLEVTALAAVTFGIFPQAVVPNLGLLVPVAEVAYTYGWEFTETDDTLYYADGFTYSSTHLSWDSAVAPSVKRNGTVVATSEYAVDYPNGRVTFTAAQAASDAITASYTYTLPEAVQEATGVIATSLLGEAGLAKKGMTGLASVRIDELTLARTMSREGQAKGVTTPFNIPDAAQQLLDPYRFHSVG